MPTPTDTKLYERVKKDLFSIYTKPSAYRSGLLVQKYKDEYVKKHNNYNYYSGNKETSNIRRWFEERWRNETGGIGYREKGNIYRPTIRINEKTPITFYELSLNQIIKAKQEKAKQDE